MRSPRVTPETRMPGVRHGLVPGMVAAALVFAVPGVAQAAPAARQASSPVAVDGPAGAAQRGPGPGTGASSGGRRAEDGTRGPRADDAGASAAGGSAASGPKMDDRVTCAAVGAVTAVDSGRSLPAPCAGAPSGSAVAPQVGGATLPSPAAPAVDMTSSRPPGSGATAADSSHAPSGAPDVAASPASSSDASARSGASGVGTPSDSVPAFTFPPDLIASVRNSGGRPAALALRVSAARCDGGWCSATVWTGGPAESVRVVLRRGGKALCWVSRGPAARPARIALRPRGRLRRGRYTVVATVRTAAGATRTASVGVSVR
jgi:hypothetical protein